MVRTLLPVYLLVAAVYAMLVTYMTGDLIEREWLSSFYDSLGSHLLRLNAEVDPDSIKWEGFTIKGKVYGYFGLFPALLRIILNATWPEFRGQWSRVSCALAGFLCVVSFGTMVSVVSARNTRLSESKRRLLRALLIFGFAFGTPVTYLVSCARVYHEAILWGLCGAMGCLCVVGTLLVGPPKSHLPIFMFSCAAFVTLLSRVTFAVPLIIASPIIIALGAPDGLINPFKQRRAFLRRVALSAPLITALIVGAWYNYARFGSPVRFIDYAGTYVNLKEMQGEFNLFRIPDALRSYMSFSTEYFMSGLPFVRMLTVDYRRPELFSLGWREQSIPYPVAATWLVVLASVGLWCIRKMERRTLLISYALCLMVQVLLILSFYFVTQRYSSELLPLLCLLVLPWLLCTNFSRLTAGGLGLVVLFSSYATVASTLDWNMIHNGDSSFAYKRLLRSAFMPVAKLSSFSGEVMYLSDMRPIDEVASFVPMRGDRNVEGGELEVGGVIYPKGIGVHAHSRLTYAVPAEAEVFSALLSPSPSEMKCTLMSYRMRALGPHDTVLFESMTFNHRSAAVPIDLDVRGLSTLTLEVISTDSRIDCDHGNWVMAQFRLRGK